MEDGPKMAPSERVDERGGGRLFGTCSVSRRNIADSQPIILHHLILLPYLSYEHSCLLNHHKYMILTMLFICVVKFTDSEEIKKWKTMILG